MPVSDILWILSHIEWVDVIDVLLVAAIFYLVLSIAQGTQAVQLLRGVVLVILLTFLVSQALPLQGLRWLVASAFPALLVAIPVIFQPELRRAFERIGRTGSLLVRRREREEEERLADEVTRAAHRLAGERHGALIVFERETGLQEFIEAGVPINAEVRAELLRTIFHPNTPLHDKAVVIREGRIVAASVMLPVTHNPRYSGMGTRHRAAIGLTEESDALVIVVSEETGIISVAHNGRIIRRLDTNTLRNMMLAFFEHRLAGRSWTAEN
jgi:diadenylate cyclase